MPPLSSSVVDLDSLNSLVTPTTLVSTSTISPEESHSTTNNYGTSIDVNKHSDEFSSVECPPGGVIDFENYPSSIDQVTNTTLSRLPTGLLRERAVELILAVMNVKTIEERRRFITEGLELCASKGLTAVQTNDEGSMELYRSLQV